ncbi:phytanoyl-CoA dioxygenase family protein [Cohnella herbarum]|uniref:Phytanoyl-CoA dioxygenase family protein n=1 Tax=Cohnella herbarum TaxID=2728023 RepID=A0A7Z2ZMX4_9BACL|nr:phytanoyl-CoA dioxygenase family protein [Cohnella herbarum]QJD85474.1 phytanoyl-CoA dioxygenase family protein [Cohnella herbarum]
MDNRQRSGGNLNKDQLEHYHTNGYVVLTDLLSDEDMQAPKQAMMEKVSWIADELYGDGMITDKLENLPFEYRLSELFKGMTDKEFLKYGRSWRDRIPGYYRLMSNPKILDAVESLIGGEIFSNPVYNVRPKVPGVAAGAVPWHQDKSYWPDANSNPVITVWISFVDATLENGCLHLKPGTHRKKLLKWHEESTTGTGYTALKDEQIGKAPTVALPVKAGTAILFNDRLLHMSTPNQSDGIRWSVDLRYQPTDQDPMANHGAGFLARSYEYPDRVATLEDWLHNRNEHSPE